MQICGVVLPISSMYSSEIGQPAAYESAVTCSTVFEEQPIAISARSAFSNAGRVRISSGRIFCSSRAITRSPVSLASRIRAASTAGVEPLPGSAMPITSVRQFIEFAVNIPAQEPQPGQALFSSRASSASSILPAAHAPTASNISVRLSLRSPSAPGSIGPPLTKIEGMLTRQAAISIPGTILSQFGINTAASIGWAVSMTSIESAISSREQREYFIPLWFIARPSHTPIVLKVNGTPPALRIPSSTALVILSRWVWPGI